MVKDRSLGRTLGLTGAMNISWLPFQMFPSAFPDLLTEVYPVGRKTHNVHQARRSTSCTFLAVSQSDSLQILPRSTLRNLSRPTTCTPRVHYAHISVQCSAIATQSKCKHEIYTVLIYTHQVIIRDTLDAQKAGCHRRLSLAAPVRVAELDQCRKNIGHEHPLGIVRLKLHHVAPVLPERPLVLRVLEVVCKPGSPKWKGVYG